MKNDGRQERKRKLKKALNHKSIIMEFKEFALQGNVMDMAIAAVVALSFGAIVNSLVNNIILALIGSIVSTDFEKLVFVVNGVDIKYGLFIQAVVNFFIITVILFIAVKFINLFRSNKNENACESDDDSADIKGEEKSE
jgi:large conductance mechanosensitive channel